MKFPLLLLTFIVISSTACLNKENDHSFVLSKQSADNFIYIDPQADELTKWAANDLAQGIEKLLGREIKLEYTSEFIQGTKGIYVGALEDQLTANLPEDYSQKLEGKWENFIIKSDQETQNLFIIGSDLRGAVYGIFDLEERMGISPWQWWADVTPSPKEDMRINLPFEGILDGPSVQYRGIFLNDEDWGLQPWAAHTFEPETNDIGPKTYEKIFQLLLRLKANTIWPAMHPSTKAFFSIPGNKEMAEKYHIFISTSHAEPMLRNNVDEWDKEQNGEYNYFTNSEKVKAYWQERINETTEGNYIYTLGMRGIHDSGMEGDATIEEKAKLVETIIDDQREMLSNTLERPVTEIPQLFIPYKEVLYLYDNGLQVPEDITLMWTDDNYGYIRRLSNETEQQRAGGSGVYYHLSYWGRPHDYLWLSTTQPGLIWYEMTRAYQNGAQKIWIANVGDIKPAEYNTEFFLDLAWGIDDITEETIQSHLINWCAREFGQETANEIASLKEEYYRLAFLRKPEYMGWSQVERITPVKPTDFSDDELKERINSYLSLYDKVNQLKPLITKEKQDAFFQLVAYPVKASALMNLKFLYAQQAFEAKDKEQKNILSSKAQVAYDSIVSLTATYNHEIANGKWNQMMSMSPRNLPVFEMPVYHLADSLSPLEDSILEKTLNTHPIFIQASDFSTSSSPDKEYEWKSVEGLGYSNSSVTLFPFKNHYFKGEAPYLEYNFTIEKAGEYELEIRCLPTHSNNFDHKIWIESEGTVSDSIALNTKGRSSEWKENVLRNYASATFSVSFDKKGKHVLKVYVNQTGIVIDQMVLARIP